MVDKLPTVDARSIWHSSTATNIVDCCDDDYDKGVRHDVVKRTSLT
jgi:hypothetical protein